MENVLLNSQSHDLSMDKETYLKRYAAFQTTRDKVSQDPWRLTYHIQPESGWLNDPNGLCQFQGVYHMYYQYSPFDVEGKTKVWGHVTSRDFIHYRQEEPVLFPDQRCDERGVYSGSAYVEDDMIHYYYTGNVKRTDRSDYDYIYEGREQNLIHTTSNDGYHFNEKQWLLTNEDYPDTMSCHVRDPKVFKKEDRYYMVIGARSKRDQGCVLLYQSEDLLTWSYHMCITTKEPFGYMWECPDLFALDGQLFLMVCPQGVDAKGYEYANVHQCGYFPLTLDLEKKTYDLQAFHQLDRGFDFYAPQSFVDESGRRIMIGWMGLPDIEYQNPTVEHGWQHALAMPRELKQYQGVLYQQPLQEMHQLRSTYYKGSISAFSSCIASSYECHIQVEKQNSFVLQLRQGALLSYHQSTRVLSLTFDACGYGRSERCVSLHEVKDITIYADTSSFEIFINQGVEVFTSRVYAPSTDKELKWITTLEGTMSVYELSQFTIE